MVRLHNALRPLIIVSCAGLASIIVFLIAGRNSKIATILVGVDDINSRSLFYDIVNAKGISGHFAKEDSIIIYSPLDGEVQDKRKVLAEELSKV